MISGGRDTRRKKEVGELKSTGIVRPVDNLGRIVLPIELRRVLDIDKDAALEVYVDNDSIVLKKYQPACIFCGSAEGVAQYQGRNICGACREAIAALKLKAGRPRCRSCVQRIPAVFRVASSA